MQEADPCPALSCSWFHHCSLPTCWDMLLLCPWTSDYLSEALALGHSDPPASVQFLSQRQMGLSRPFLFHFVQRFESRLAAAARTNVYRFFLFNHITFYWVTMSHFTSISSFLPYFLFMVTLGTFEEIRGSQCKSSKMYTSFVNSHHFYF